MTKKLANAEAIVVIKQEWAKTVKKKKKELNLNNSINFPVLLRYIIPLNFCLCSRFLRSGNKWNAVTSEVRALCPYVCVCKCLRACTRSWRNLWLNRSHEKKCVCAVQRGEGEGGGGGGAECVCVSEAPEQRRVHTLTHSLRSRTEMVAQWTAMAFAQQW